MGMNRRDILKAALILPFAADVLQNVDSIGVAISDAGENLPLIQPATELPQVVFGGRRITPLYVTGILHTVEGPIDLGKTPFKWGHMGAGNPDSRFHSKVGDVLRIAPEWNVPLIG